MESEDIEKEQLLGKSSQKYDVSDDPSDVDTKQQIAVATIGPWRWLILLGCIYIAIVLASLAPCFGVLFGDFLASKNISSTKIAWILNSHLFLWNFCSMFGSPICRHFSWRTTGFTLSFIVALAFLVIALFPSPVMIFLMFSLIVGPFGGTATIICLNSLPHYFPDQTGRASSLYMSGTACGQVIMPILSHYLQNKYGFAGATLVFSGLLLNACVCFALFRTVQNCTVDKELRTLKSLIIDISKQTWKNFKSLRYPKLLIVCGSKALQMVSFVNFISLVPLALINAGFSNQVASYSLAAIGIGNIMTRFVMVVISDKSWLNKRKVFLGGLLVILFSQCVIPLSLKTKSLVFWMLVGLGVGLAIVNSLFVVLMIDTVGMELYESGLANTCVIVSFAAVTIGPLIGFMRDKSGSYEVSMYSAATLMLLSILMWLFMPCAEKKSTYVK